MSDMLDWFSSLSGAHPEMRFDLLARLLLASVLGGAVGWEREHAHKPAGLRTNIVICMASAVLTDLSVRVAGAGGSTGDPGRIAAQIVTGVGFLGAGTIIQSRRHVIGLTTAATLWLVAAIGMAVGFGALVEAVGTTLLALIVLIPLRRLEGKVPLRRWDDERSGRGGPPA